MSVLSEFKTALKTYLGATYYYRKAPSTATYPYKVGSFNGSFDDENAEVYALELDYWDDGNDDDAVYTLIAADMGNGDSVNPTGLNKKKFHLASGTVVLAKDTEVQVEDPDNEIIHIRVSMTARIYRKEL